MPTPMRTPMNRRRPHVSKESAAAVVLLVVLAAGFLVSRGRQTDGDDHAAGASLGAPTSPFVADGPLMRFAPDGHHRIVLDRLGLGLTVGPVLGRQGLEGIPGKDPSRRSASISFATRELAAKPSACIDGATRGWVGTLTRYEGSSAAMADHARHSLATFDYPGFHTVYRTVTQLCPRRAPGSTVAERAPERLAAAELWQAIRGQADRPAAPASRAPPARASRRAEARPRRARDPRPRRQLLPAWRPGRRRAARSSRGWSARRGSAPPARE